MGGELHKILKSCDPKGQEYLMKNAVEKDDVWLDTKTGLMFKILEKGQGDRHPKVGTKCSCNYAGTTIDGKEFDSSFKRGTPLEFAPNQVIKGWTIAMQQMVAG